MRTHARFWFGKCTARCCLMYAQWLINKSRPKQISIFYRLPCTVNKQFDRLQMWLWCQMECSNSRLHECAENKWVNAAWMNWCKAHQRSTKKIFIFFVLLRCEHLRPWFLQIPIDGKRLLRFYVCVFVFQGTWHSFDYHLIRYYSADWLAMSKSEWLLKRR